MKKRVLALALLVAVLTGCAGQDASSPVTGGAAWSFPEGPAPAEEYERFSWYGFGEENPDRNPSAAATEKEMADMLAAVIEAAGVEGWRELTAHASDEGIYRDYCAMFLLYAAEHMDATEFTMGFAPYLLGGRTDENWDAFGTDIRGGYRLFEEFGENWDRVCVSVSSQMEDRQVNYLNASQNFVVSRLSLITGEPLLDFDYGTFTMHLTEPLTYEDAAVAAVRLFESLPETAERFPEDQAVTARVEELLQAGRDVLVLAFSSGLSATFQSSKLAVEELSEKYPERKLYTVDTLCASLGQGLLVWYAAQERKKGRTIEEVRDWAEANKLSLCHQFTVDDLHFLKRGGRISATTAVVGSMLQIKPVLHVDNEGHLVNISKARGRRASLKALVDKMEQTAIDPADQTVFISHGDCLEDAQLVAQMVKDRFNVQEVYLNYVGPVIGAHSGPGTLALFYVGVER